MARWRVSSLLQWVSVARFSVASLQICRVFRKLEMPRLGCDYLGNVGKIIKRATVSHPHAVPLATDESCNRFHALKPVPLPPLAASRCNAIVARDPSIDSNSGLQLILPQDIREKETQEYSIRAQRRLRAAPCSTQVQYCWIRIYRPLYSRSSCCPSKERNCPRDATFRLHSNNLIRWCSMIDIFEFRQRASEKLNAVAAVVLPHH